MKIRKKRTTPLLFGIGIQDADYTVLIRKNVFNEITGKSVNKVLWACPYYVRWSGMFSRCYSKSRLRNDPTYLGCEVGVGWHRFSDFKAWMEAQDWEDKDLDKDILFTGNKIYSSETCVFIDPKINKFLTERGRDRGIWPIGVSWDKTNKRFKSSCNSVCKDVPNLSKLFDNPDDAHRSWLAFKLKQAYILAEQQTDERVAKALIDRYTNYLN